MEETVQKKPLNKYETGSRILTTWENAGTIPITWEEEGKLMHVSMMMRMSEMCEIVFPRFLHCAL
jgi:hypothetical protein